MNRELERDAAAENEVVKEELEPTMGLDYLVEVTDKDGKVIQRIAAPSRSFVRQWYDIMCAEAAFTVRTLKTTAGVSKSVYGHLGDMNFYAKAPAGETAYGIRVGKGTTAVTISDYVLENPLEEGTGTDEFEHGTVGYTVPSVVGSTCSFTLSRVMVNHSGATITGIKEIGCYVQFQAVGPSTDYALGFRDIIPSAVYVPDGGAITVTYTIKVTV